MKRALIVEDHPTWASILTQYCHKADLAPSVASSPQMAMDMLDESVPDIIILDMLLATETGMALLNEMKGYEDLAGIPIVICSSLDIASIGELEPYGVVALMSKQLMAPDEASALFRRVAYGE